MRPTTMKDITGQTNTRMAVSIKGGVIVDNPKVFVLMLWPDSEEGRILGIYASKAGAMKALNKLEYWATRSMANLSVLKFPLKGASSLLFHSGVNKYAN